MGDEDEWHDEERDVEQHRRERTRAELPEELQHGVSDREPPHEEEVRKQDAKERDAEVEARWVAAHPIGEQAEERAREDHPEGGRDTEHDEHRAAHSRESGAEPIAIVDAVGAVERATEDRVERVACGAFREHRAERIRNTERLIERVSGTDVEDRRDHDLARESEQSRGERSRRKQERVLPHALDPRATVVCNGRCVGGGRRRNVGLHRRTR